MVRIGTAGSWCVLGLALASASSVSAQDDGLPGGPLLSGQVPAGPSLIAPRPRVVAKTPAKTARVAKKRGSFIGLDGIVNDPRAKRGQAARIPNMRGTRVGSWLGFWSDAPLTITDAVGRFPTRADAIRAAQRHEGGAILLTNPDGSYDVYGLDDHRSADMTLDNVEQVDGYTVTDLSTKGSQVDRRFGGLVTEDGSVLKRPGRFSNGRYLLDRDPTVEIWTAERAADELHRALDGAGTDEVRAYEALANIPTADRPTFAQLFEDRHGDGDLKSWLDGDLNDITTQRILADHMLAATAPIYSGQELKHDMRKALEAYPGRLRDSSSVIDTVLLTPYLANFAATNNETINAPFRTGQEFALKQAIERDSERRGRRLSPGEVFGLALGLNKGDTYKAVLTSHNTIRALARGLDDKLNEQVPGSTRDRGHDMFGLTSNTQFMREHLQPIRGGKDEAGAWYHLFGVATMSMVGGEAAATSMAYVEEYAVSGDANTDPLELYIDMLGVDLGTQAGR